MNKTESPHPLCQGSTTYVFCDNGSMGEDGLAERLRHLEKLEYERTAEWMQRPVTTRRSILDGKEDITYTLGIIFIRLRRPDAEYACLRVEVQITQTYGPTTTRVLLAEAVADLQIIGFEIQMIEQQGFWKEVDRSRSDARFSNRNRNRESLVELVFQ